MHLQRAIPAAQSNAPVTITDDLNLLVTGRFNIQLDKHIFVVADARCFHLVKNLANQLGSAIGLAQRHNALALAASTTDGFQAHPILRILLAHFEHRFGQRLAELFDGVEVNALAIARGEHRLSQCLQVTLWRLAL